MSASFVLVEHKCSKLSTKRLVMKKCTEDRSLIKECVKRDGLFTIQIQLGVRFKSVYLGLNQMKMRTMCYNFV